MNELYKKVLAHIKASESKLIMLDFSNPLERIKSPSQREIELLNKNDKSIMLALLRDPELLQMFYGDIPYCTPAYLYQICKEVPIIEQNGVYYWTDMESDFFNTIDGRRITIDQPDEFSNTIYFFGDCNIAGFRAEDSFTVCSQLQRMLNKKQISRKIYKVANEACGYADPEGAIKFNRILATDFCKGDIGVACSACLEQFKNNKAGADCVFFADILQAFERPHNMGEVFFNKEGQLNHKGYNLMAKQIFSFLEEISV